MCATRARSPGWTWLPVWACLGPPSPPRWAASSSSAWPRMAVAAASRGGRRSTLVDLDAGLRFVGIDLGVTSMRVAVTDGRLGVLARATVVRC